MAEEDSYGTEQHAGEANREPDIEEDTMKWFLCWVTGDVCVTGEDRQIFDSEEEARNKIVELSNEDGLEYMLIKGELVEEK